MCSPVSRSDFLNAALYNPHSKIGSGKCTDEKAVLQRLQGIF